MTDESVISGSPRTPYLAKWAFGHHVSHRLHNPRAERLGRLGTDAFRHLPHDLVYARMRGADRIAQNVARMHEDRV